MPSSCMQSVQKGEKAYSDGRIAVPETVFYSTVNIFLWQESIIAATVMTLLLQAGAPRKVGPRCRCILHTHISAQAGAPRKARARCSCILHTHISVQAGAPRKARARCSRILHTHISVQAGAPRKAGRICKQPPATPLFHTARHKESLPQRSFSLAEGGSL